MFNTRPVYFVNGIHARLSRRARAESDAGFLPGGKYFKDVQRALNALSDNRYEWSRHNLACYTDHNGGKSIKPAVVAITPEDDVFWAAHRGRSADDLSPFVRDPTIKEEDCGTFTIELAGTPKRPSIWRIYGGEYMMPTPLSGRAKIAMGGVKACAKFWLTHAYRYDGEDNLYVPGAERPNYRPAWVGMYPELYGVGLANH